MKRIKYDGTYKVEPGDFLIYQKNGTSVITERELREQESPAIPVPLVRLQTQYEWFEYELVGKQICGCCVYYNGNPLCKQLRGGASFTAPVYNCPDYKNKTLKEQKMKNYFMLDGKKVPMSDETAASLRKKSRVPMVRKARIFGEDRIVLRLSDSMKKDIAKYPNSSIFGFDPKGHLCGNGDDSINCYDDTSVTLFEGE